MSRNIIYHNAVVTREKRSQLYKLGCRTFVLDGDNVRYGPSSDLSFSENDRKENIRRICYQSD